MIFVSVLAPCRSASGPISPTEEGALLTDGIRAAVEWPAPILAVTFHMPESREQAAVALHRLCRRSLRLDPEGRSSGNGLSRGVA